MLLLPTLRRALANINRKAGLYYSAADGHVHLVQVDGTDRKMLDSRDSGGGGSGDVVGPASATSGAPAVFDGTTGKLLKQLVGEGVLGLVSGVLTKITTTLGDLVYGGASGTPTRLAGNITTTRKFLRQTGDGAASAAPAWDTVTAADVGLGNVENAAASGLYQPIDASLAPFRILGRCDPISTIVASSANSHIRRRMGSPSIIELAPLAWADEADAVTNVPTGWTLTNPTALTSAAISSGENTIAHDGTTADAYGTGTSSCPYYSVSRSHPTGVTVQIMRLRVSGGTVGALHCAWGYAAGRLTMGVDIACSSASDYRLRVLADDAVSITILTGQSAATATTGWWVRLEIDWTEGSYRVDYASASGAVPTTAAGWTFGGVGQSTGIVNTSRTGTWVWAVAVKRTSGVAITGYYTCSDEYVPSAEVREATYAPWRTAGLTTASDAIVFAASIDCGVARLPDQTLMRTILADAANQMPGDAASWTWSVTGQNGANPAAATTYQSAAALTIKQAGSNTAASAPGYTHWRIAGKSGSASGTQTGTVDVNLLVLVTA